MARFFALEFLNNQRSGRGAGVVFSLLGLMTFLGVTSRVEAQAMMQSEMTTGEKPTTNAAPAQTKAPAVSKAPATAPTTAANNNKPPTPPPALPPPVPDTFNRYGKIWAPSDDVAHPIKLNVQFPGVGEMKIPSQDELNVRDKLEQLATLSDDDIRAQLALWPPYAKMKLADEGNLLIRIQAFKEQRTKIAMDRARDLGLLNSLTPEQKAKFEKEYWDKRLQMDHELAKQFEPIFKAKEQKLREDLFREFSTVGTVIPAPPGAKPPAMPVAQTKPAPAPAPQNPTVKPPDVPIGQGKPAPGSTPTTAQNPGH
jgi:hypothetical protein